MQRGHGCEYIGISCIKYMENRKSSHFIKASKTRDIPGSTRNSIKPMNSNIPWRSSGMNVIASETDKIDDEEYKSKSKIVEALPGKINP